MYSQPFIIGTLFVLGLLIGSFLNVVILRWNTGMRISKGRSKCFSCDKTLAWFELIPMFSFLVQKGKCRGCDSKISFQYPFIELAGGIALPLAYISIPTYLTPIMSASLFAIVATLLCTYIVIAVYDLRHKIIPDFFSYGAAILALMTLGIEWMTTGQLDCTRIIAGPILFLFFFFFNFVSRGRWMGLGDAKLALSIGWFLGLSSGIVAILFSFWIGAIISVGLILLQKAGLMKGHLGLSSEIPFGPFILLGFLIVFVFHLNIEIVFSVLAV